MAKQTATQWESNINGQRYQFSHERIKGKQTITVNGVQQVVKMGIISSFLGFDEAFTFDGHQARLIIAKNKPDVAVDGVLLQSGKPYIQRPAWAMVFAVLCILIPIVTLGGALPFLLGVGGAAINVSISKTSLPPAARVALCVLVTLVAWALWFVLILSMAALNEMM